MSHATPSPREPRAIPVRNPSFDYTNERRYWVEGEPALTHLLHALSASFPEGERMFMDSVAHYRSRIVDPVLRKEVARFLAQEATHAKAHEELNAWVAGNGFDLEPLLQSVRDRVEEGKKARPIVRLAVTCALEHFTAIMAEQILEEPDLLDRFDPKLAELWLWHAIEETEHKAVAFDVYQQVSGSYPRRALVMLLVTFRFITHIAWMQHTLVKNDPEARTFRARFKAAWTLWGRPGYFRKLAPAWLDYFRPGFHPWDRDVEAALERAREKLGYDRHGRDATSRENPPKAA